MCCNMHYIFFMKEKTIQIRVSDDEKLGFEASANLAGISLSSWIRERLRLAAIKDLESAGERAPFLRPLRIESDPNE